ncbi:MAG: 16S rRNA (cytosine(1402)-N(4))-methyltransferase, partial [Ilumatobacteraceae bacterium]
MTTQNPQVASHLPVMVDEIVECFSSVPEGVIVDATFGLGGHAVAILNAYPNLQ